MRIWPPSTLTTHGARRDAPAARRNEGPIQAVLAEHLPPSGRMLEIAAGTGQHSAAFARAFRGWWWLPTDADPDAMASIDAWREAAGVDNLQPPRVLDVQQANHWDGIFVDAILCVNMVHISPFSATESLFSFAHHALPEDGTVFLYGPYHIDGMPTSEGNAAFDAQLRSANASWGIRDVAEVAQAASKVGFSLRQRISMPANNQTLIFTKTQTLLSD